MYRETYYDFCAPAYRRYLEPMVSPLLDLLLSSLHLSSEDRVLDICTGTGLVLEKLRLRFPNTYFLVGIDISLPMLKQAQTRTLPHNEISLVRMEAEQLALTSNHFSLVTMHMALHHLKVKKALGEILRVLRPGGMLAIQVFDPIRNRAREYSLIDKLFYLLCERAQKYFTLNPSTQLQTVRQQHHQKEADTKDHQPPNKPPNSNFQPQTLQVLAQEVGFSQVNCSSLTAQISFPDVEAIFHYHINQLPYYQKEFAEMPAEKKARFLSALAANVKKHCQNIQGAFVQNYPLTQLFAYK